MKAKSTIQREIRRLQAMAENERYTQVSREVAYEAYHALRWVLGYVGFTPHGEVGRYLELTTAEKSKEEAKEGD